MAQLTSMSNADYSQNDWNSYLAKTRLNASRQDQYDQAANINNRTNSNIDNASNITNSSTGTSSSSTDIQQQAKDMANFQLGISNQQATTAYNNRSNEISHNDQVTQSQNAQKSGLAATAKYQDADIARGAAQQQFQDNTSYKNQDADIASRQSQQNYGFQRGLNDQQNTQQTAMQTAQNTQQTNMFNMQDAAQARNTQSARGAADALYFGQARNRGGFQGRS